MSTSQSGMISCVGQVTLAGKPFVRTVVGGNDFGQLTPRDAMNMGTRFIMAAIEAEMDSGIVRGMLDAGESKEAINQRLTTMRKYRDSADPDLNQCITHPRYPSE